MNWAEILKVLLEKLSIKQFLFSLFVVLALVFVPHVNYLEAFLLPLEGTTQWLKLIFCVLVGYFVLLALHGIFKGIGRVFRFFAILKEDEETFSRHINNYDLSIKNLFLSVILNKNPILSITINFAQEKKFQLILEMLKQKEMVNEYKKSEINDKHAIPFFTYTIFFNKIFYKNLCNAYKKDMILQSIKEHKND